MNSNRSGRSSREDTPTDGTSSGTILGLDGAEHRSEPPISGARTDIERRRSAGVDAPFLPNGSIGRRETDVAALRLTGIETDTELAVTATPTEAGVALASMSRSVDDRALESLGEIGSVIAR